tara:strand:+ start:324 stop:461 length:138 start_codon:yes stop_codon:yes gene_type:complete
MNKKHYSVWVDGSEVNDYYLTKKEAQFLADEWKKDNYKPIIRKEK